MNSDLILKSDILDVIFEKRNKAYGAYVLRKFYQSRLKVSLTVMLGVAIIFSLLTRLPAKTVIGTVREYIFEETETAKLEEPRTEIPPEPQPPKPPADPKAAMPAINQLNFSNNIKVVDSSTAVDSVRNIDDNTRIGNTTVTNPSSGPGPVQPGPPPGNNEPADPVKVDKTLPLELGAVDVPLSFPGGTEALMSFLRRHLNNPEPMAEGESVSVKVTFVVGYEGKLKGFKVIQDGGEVFNKEVIRVLKKMPDWIPGKAKGENVSVYYSIPVKFTGSD